MQLSIFLFYRSNENATNSILFLQLMHRHCLKSHWMLSSCVSPQPHETQLFWFGFGFILRSKNFYCLSDGTFLCFACYKKHWSSSGNCVYWLKSNFKCWNFIYKNVGCHPLAIMAIPKQKKKNCARKKVCNNLFRTFMWINLFYRFVCMRRFEHGRNFFLIFHKYILLSLSCIDWIQWFSLSIMHSNLNRNT